MDTADENLYGRAAALLEPGDIELHGAVIHTDHGSDEESLVHQATLEVGDIIADHRDIEEWYVYSGNDDPDFGLNQHQGLTVADEFLWECQQLLRDGSFDVVVYWEAAEDHASIIEDVREAGYEAVGVTAEGVRDAGSRVA